METAATSPGGDRRSLPLIQEAPRCRRQSQRHREQHTRADARRLARIVLTTALMRGFSGESGASSFCWRTGADPKIKSSDGETMVEAAAGLGFIQG